MFRTPPLKSEATFSTPLKQVLTPEVDTGSDSNVIDFDVEDKEIHHKPYLPTPRTPLDQTLNQSSPPGKGLRVNTSNQFQYYKGSHNYTPNSSPLSSPVSLFSNDSTQLSSPSDSHYKYIPHSTVLTDEEVQNELEDYIIDPNFKFDIQSNAVIGKGSFSTVLKAKSNNNVYAIKIPTSSRNSRPIYREALNYRIISSYLQLHDFNCDEFPILNVYGLTYLTKTTYPKLRAKEVAPCLVSTSMSSNLEMLIKRSTGNGTSLRIGEDLWWKLAKELVMGLIVLKDCEIIHSDLKTSNILFDANNEEFKIADFTSAGLKNDIVDEFNAKAQCGLSIDITLQYAAPELLNNSNTPPSFQTDLYAVGLILLCAAIGQEPYSEVIRDSNRSSFIYLTECIKKNKVLDMLSDEGYKILHSNPNAYNLIKSILIDRVDLGQVISIVSNF